MLRLIRARLEQGRRTLPVADRPGDLPRRFRGRPAVDPSRCTDGCAACADACPTEAIRDAGKASMAIDLGRCLFCPDCTAACPTGALRFTSDHRLSSRSRDGLVVARDEPLLAEALGAELRRTFGRSLKLRQVSAAGCNGCEAELNASGNIQFDAGRFGIQFVASPRHADGIVVTGPVSENMALALRKTYEAVPPPRIVVAVGACAISGGPFRGSPVVHDGAAPALQGIPVDLFVPGCPPHPITFLDGLLRMLGRLGPREGLPAAAAAAR